MSADKRTMTDRFLVLSGIPLPEGERTDPESPMMSPEDMTRSLNEMAEQGWLYVGSGSKYVPDYGIQTWVVFRREEKPKERDDD